MNFIHIAGHLGADPETRFTQSGKKVTTLRVATNSRKGGQDVTIWWRVTIWDDQFKNILPFMKKGSAVMVFGDVQKPEIFNDRDGKPQVSMDITAIQLQFSPFGKSGNPQAPGAVQENKMQNSGPVGGYSDSPNPYMGGSSMSGSPGFGSPQGATFDDEVPF